VQVEHHAPGCARMLIDGRPFREIESNCWDPKRRLEECDACGVDVQVLSTVPVMFSYWAKPADGHDLARLLNDHLAMVAARTPQRFVALGTLPMQAPDFACRELERCVRELGFAGVQIGTHVNGWNLDQPELFPVFERAQALGASVLVHPWDMMGKERMERYFLQWLVGMPAETTLAICSLIFGGVFDRLPKLKICFAHGGGSFAGTLARIDAGYRARPDLCGVNNCKRPRDYLRSFYVDSLVQDARTLRFLIELMTVERIALGSDYPFPLGEEHPGRLIEAMPELSDADRERLLSGTALEFLGLRRETFASRAGARS